MQTIQDPALALFYILFPALLIYITQKSKFLGRVGTVVLAYISGLLIGNLGILPESSAALQETLTHVSVPLAIPLLLFSLNVRNWIKQAGKAMLSMGLAIVSTALIVFTGYMMFGHDIEEGWKISGMLVGVYSGGTPNLAAIGTALEVSESNYILTHSYDLLFSAVFIFLMISFGKRILLLILPDFIVKTAPNSSVEESANSVEDYTGFFKKRTLLPLLLALGLAILALGAGGLMDMMMPESIKLVTAILTITSLGIGLSFIPAVQKIKKTFELGMYFILVFCLVIASMVDIGNFTEINTSLFYFVGFAVFGTLIVHVLLSAVFRIDTDTTIITSTALICSPPFVPVVAGALKNKYVVISGLTVGIIGYAIGNYLGILFAYILK